VAQIGRVDDAIDTYDDLLRRFGDAPEPAHREQVAAALFGKALSQEMLGKKQEAISTDEQTISRFGSSSEAALQEQVAYAQTSLKELQADAPPSP